MSIMNLLVNVLVNRGFTIGIRDVSPGLGLLKLKQDLLKSG